MATRLRKSPTKCHRCGYACGRGSVQLWDSYEIALPFCSEECAEDHIANDVPASMKGGQR